MWVFIGSGRRFEPVENGRRAQRRCEKCGNEAVFYEKRMTRTISIYFMDLAAFDPKTLMVCGACSAGYAVDDQGPSDFLSVQKGTALGALAQAADSARRAVEDGTAQQKVQELESAATEALSSASRWFRRRMK